MRAPSFLLAAPVLLARSCAGPPSSAARPGDSAAADTTAAPAAAAVVLVDSTRPLAVAGDPGWGYRRESSVDLDGDGMRERVVLLAEVGLYRGEPTWEDGHRWQLYVEEPGGERTYLFARLIPLGRLDVMVTAADSGRAPTLLLVELPSNAMRVYEARYRGPKQARVTPLLDRSFDPRAALGPAQ